MADELVSVTESAEILGTTRAVVHYLIRQGILSPLRLPPKGRTKGHKVYLRRSEVEGARGKWRPRRE